MSEVLSKSRLARLGAMGEGTIVAELTTRIAKLEAENARLTEGWRLNVEMLKQEVARLSDHIRAIADYHDGLKYSLLDGVRSLAWELHHTERRDFALKVFDVLQKNKDRSA